MITRRDCLKHSGLAAAALATAGCAPLTRGLSQPQAPEGWADAADGRVSGAVSDALLRRVVNRTSFGPRPGDLQHIQSIGIDAYLKEQLHPEALEESPAIAWRLWPLDTLQVDTDFRFEFPKEQVQAELQQAAVIRAVYSRRATMR